MSELSNLHLGYRYIGLRDRDTAVFETARGSQIRLNPKNVTAIEVCPWSRKRWQVLVHVLGLDAPIQSIWNSEAAARHAFEEIDHTVNNILF